MIAHVVLFEPNEEATPEARSAFLTALENACRSIPGILHARIGRAVQIGAGYETRPSRTIFSYGAWLEFGSRDDLLAYLAHPAHQKVSELFWQTCSRTEIVDLEVGDPTKSSLGFLT